MKRSNLVFPFSFVIPECFYRESSLFFIDITEFAAGEHPQAYDL
jgi:hypothetical protein